MSANLCSYIKKPCDCKFIQDSNENIMGHGESGFGCPEAMTVALLLEQMTEEEFLTISKRVVTQPSVYELIKKFQKERFDKLSRKNK